MPPASAVDGPHPGVDAAVAAARLVDHHVHSIVQEPPDAVGFLAMLTESDRPAAVAGWDTQLGIAIRRWCAPLLGLPSHASGEAYLEHRLSMPTDEVASTLLGEAGLAKLVVDTGFRADSLLDLDALGRLAGAETHAIVRLEAVAEDLARSGVSASAYPEAFRDAIHQALPNSVGWKTVLAYRGGLDIDAEAPRDTEVVDAAGRWLSEVSANGRARLTDRVLLRFGIWEAVRTGRPLQVHTGFGDTDLDLQRADPALLTTFLRATEGLAPILLLHTYPFHRHAGYLAQMFGHVHMDVGLALHHTGAASDRIVAESLELAPLTRILFSSDAWGLPELHLLGSWLFRRGLARTLGGWVAAGDWSLDDARRTVELIGWANAQRVYGLGS